ncbi:hypothetical protein ACTHO0_22170 [Cytobacillus praedii]|uniref:hypothetical protein n=1 Tax=Cytobacillus praedii TaxID=1742358 RepID=UPI002E2023E2|nr:hypothetical protein [Cytobacillus praedii]
MVKFFHLPNEWKAVFAMGLPIDVSPDDTLDSDCVLIKSMRGHAIDKITAIVEGRKNGIRLY